MITYGTSGQVRCRRLLISFSKTTILESAANMQNVSKLRKISVFAKIDSKIRQMTCPEVPYATVSLYITLAIGMENRRILNTQEA
jgi:hypothetical protein